MAIMSNKEKKETLPELDRLVAQLPRRGQDRLIGAGYAILMMEGVSTDSEEKENGSGNTNK